MKSARADALRLILPLLLRLATVDFFGTDDFRDLVDVLLGFDEVLFAEDRDEEDRDRPLFCATTVNGTRRAMAARATPVRLSIRNLLSWPDYRRVGTMRQGKLGRSDSLSKSVWYVCREGTIYRRSVACRSEINR